MRRAAWMVLLLALPACDASLSCEEACEETRTEDCAAPGMPACDTLCADLRAEASTAGCDDAWSALESCMGQDPVCMAASRCAEELRVHAACIDAYCADNPETCTDP